MCQKQEATKYINVCRFKINCAEIDKVKPRDNFQLTIGPDKLERLSLAGL
jgi:hypothetical protein